jgi:hypothetical protein
VNQPQDDGLGARHEELALLFGQASARPDEDGKAAAVDEVEPGEVHYEDLRPVLQRTADGAAQTVPGAQVKFALQKQHRPSPVVFGGDGQVGVRGHLCAFIEALTAVSESQRYLGGHAERGVSGADSGPCDEPGDDG